MTIDKKRLYAAAAAFPAALLLVLPVSDITVKNWLLTVLTVGFGAYGYFCIPKRTQPKICPTGRSPWSWACWALLC